MSILQYPDAINAPDLQVWDNAAFDNEASEGFAAVKGCWQNSDSFQSDCSKENLSPALVKSPASVKSIVSVKPLQPNNVSVKSNGKPLKTSAKLVFLEPVSKETNKEEGEDKVRGDYKIDSEIEEIEREIAILSERLKDLRLKKLEENLKNNERRGRIIAAKFMDPNQSFKNSDTDKKVEPSFVSASKIKFSRRGVSLGPSEIFSEVGGRRTGVSMGPSEIISGIGTRPPAKIEITPVQPIQNRRKSCFWKLHEIDELKVTKDRGKRNSMTTSPKWRKEVSKVQPVKQAATTVSSKRSVKKEGLIGTIQPKKLFKENENSLNASAKKPLKNGRVVSSRYSQIPVQINDGRKRSFPENEKMEGKRVDKKRASCESRVKKRWDIPKEVVMACEEAEEIIMPAMGVGERCEVLPVPRIRTLRCCSNESPRDSGPAKRVADLIGRRSFFGANEEENSEEEEVDPSVCQTLIFEDD